MQHRYGYPATGFIFSLEIYLSDLLLTWFLICYLFPHYPSSFIVGVTLTKIYAWHLVELS